MAEQMVRKHPHFYVSDKRKCTARNPVSWNILKPLRLMSYYLFIFYLYRSPYTNVIPKERSVSCSLTSMPMYPYLPPFVPRFGINDFVIRLNG